MERLRETRDCLKNFRATVLKRKQLDAAALDAVDREVLALIEAAVQEARAAPPPDASEVLQDVYVTY